MQVHELNDFLNHTSLRNLSGDDMTAICLEPPSVASASTSASTGGCRDFAELRWASESRRVPRLNGTKWNKDWKRAGF